MFVQRGTFVSRVCLPLLLHLAFVSIYIQPFILQWAGVTLIRWRNLYFYIWMVVPAWRLKSTTSRVRSWLLTTRPPQRSSRFFGDTPKHLKRWVFFRYKKKRIVFVPSCFDSGAWRFTSIQRCFEILQCFHHGNPAQQTHHVGWAHTAAVA